MGNGLVDINALIHEIEEHRKDISLLQDEINKKTAIVVAYHAYKPTKKTTVLNKKSKTNQKKVSLISTEGNTIPEQLLKYIKQKNKPTTTEELVSFFCTKHKIKVLEGRGKVYIRLNTMKKRKQLISYKPEESKVKGSYWFLPEWLDNNGIPLPQYDIK